MQRIARFSRGRTRPDFNARQINTNDEDVNRKAGNSVGAPALLLTSLRTAPLPLCPYFALAGVGVTSW